MHQETKLFHKEIARKSDYCPLDLFSNSPDRILLALKNLMTNPQNNFRVFVNHQLVSVDKYSYNITDLQKIIFQILQKSDILQRLLKVQMLDQFDIEYIASIYDGKKDCLFHDQLDENWISAAIHKMNSFQPKEYHCKQFNTIHTNVLPEGNAELVREFLIAHTAKDCSIMMSFYESQDGKVRVNDTSYEYKIALVDTDPKFAKDIPKYFKLDQEIAKHYETNQLLF
jgi:inositol-pentakisphosphate 2-kinase